MNKPKPIITLDLDGVVVGGGYTEEWDRTPRRYFEAPTMDQDIAKYITQLNERYDIYYVSSRAFEDCGYTSIQWLLRHHIPVGLGVITGVSSVDKSTVVSALRSSLHVDDNPVVVNSIKTRCGYIYPVMFLGRVCEESWWPESRETLKNNYHATNWEDLVYLIRSLVSCL